MTKQVRRSFDFLPLTIRLETRGGVATPLVLRGTPLPAKRSQQFSTAEDNQAEVAAKIALGESPVFKNNLALGELRLQGIPEAKKGVLSIKVEFAVDKTCSVVATATVADANLSVSEKLYPPETMTDEFIEATIAQAEATRVDDEQFLRNNEAKDRASGLVARAEARLETAPNAQLSAAIAELGLALSSGSTNAIRQRSDGLEAILSSMPDPFNIFSEVFSRPTTARKPGAQTKVQSRTSAEGRPKDSVSPKRTGRVLGKIFGGGTFTLDPQLCFVLMPFTAPLQPIYDDHIRPTIERAQLRCERADDIKGPSIITWDIWERVNRARFLVADLTNQNANVFYELGLAHAISKDVILLTQSMDFVPFDLKTMRCIPYEFTPRGMQRLEAELAVAIASLLKAG